MRFLQKQTAIYRVSNAVNRLAFTNDIHWGLLLFLVLFLNVKLLVKLLALVVIYFLQPDFQFRFRRRNSRLSLFYPAVILLALLNAFLYGGFLHANYLVVLLFGISFWMACILAAHQVKLAVEKTETETLCRTLILFFALNACISLLQYLKIVFETGALNPFLYQGNYQKYFISTGDYIKGLSFDTSTTNAVINAFGIVFFLHKKSWPMVLLCTTVLLFTASNLVNLVLFTTLFLLFVFKTSRAQKSMVVACASLFVVFMTKVSPQNNTYAVGLFEKTFDIRDQAIKAQAKPVNVGTLPDSELTAEQRREKTARIYLDSLGAAIAEQKKAERVQEATLFVSDLGKKPAIPQPSIHSPPFQNRDDTNAYRRELLAFVTRQREQYDEYKHTNLPGKALAYLQTGRYLLGHPSVVLTGAGLGNFSSKIAFKATALQFAGGFPQQYVYINPAFLSNHLGLYTYFFSKRADAHSVTNNPASVYDQLLSEYGLVGLLCFFIFYAWFFARHHKKLTYGLPLLFLMLSFFFIDYWFDQLSVVVLFELLLFLNLKESQGT